MGGNVEEWNDLAGLAGTQRGIRGGDRYTNDAGLFYYNNSFGDPSVSDYQIGGIGFRLAAPVAVPEPSTYAMALAGLACGGFSLFRRRKQACVAPANKSPTQGGRSPSRACSSLCFAGRSVHSSAPAGLS
jgi:hypothetical protein